MLSKRTRLKTFDYIGLYRYFLTFCTHKRHHAFTSRDTVNDVHAQIVRAARQCDFAIPAYVFMRDHLHLLVEATTETADLRRFAKRAKQYSGYATAFGEYEHAGSDTTTMKDIAEVLTSNPRPAWEP